MDNNGQQNFYSEPIDFEKPQKPSLKALEDPLFLALCILTTISSAISFDVFSILITIGMWMAYVNIQNAKSPLSGAKLVAGTLKALYIFNWVCVPIFFLIGAFCFIFSGVIGRSEGVMILFDKYVLAEINVTEYFLETGILDSFEDISKLITVASVVMGIALMFAAIVLILLNIFFFCKLYKFAASVRDSMTSEHDEILYADTVKTWLLVLAILNGISLPSAILSFSDVLPIGITVAVYAVAYVWIKKHFSRPVINIQV